MATTGDDPLEDLSIEEKRLLADLARARSEDRVDRRTVLQILGAGAAGAALGGGGAYAAVDQARADPSTTDSDGDVGTPSDRVDVFADGIDAASTTTEVLNNDEEPNLDISASPWLALTQAYIQTCQFRGGLTGVDQTTSGSGSISANVINGIVQLDTGSTSGSRALIRFIAPDDLILGANTFDKDGAFGVSITLVDDDADRNDYFTLGNVLAGAKGYGFKLTDVGGTPTLQAVVHNGSSETTADLTQNPGTNTFELWARFVSGDRVQFWFNSDPGNDDPDAEITTGLPSGSRDNDNLWNLDCNNTDAVRRRTRTREVRAVMGA